jgi:DNA-binding NarL/FixJ family response regulator
MMQVVTMLGDGLTMKEAALRLGLGKKTVEQHWARARVKLGLRSYVDACKFCLRNGLITL